MTAAVVEYFFFLPSLEVVAVTSNRCGNFSRDMGKEKKMRTVEETVSVELGSSR